jgi:hypothetical protein
MSFETFRSVGFDWVQHHFSEFITTRVSEEDVVPPFGPKEGNRYMEGRDVVEVRRELTGELRFIPAVVQRHDLGRGIEVLDREKRRTIPGDSAPELFWKTFDEVLSFSRDHTT